MPFFSLYFNFVLSDIYYYILLYLSTSSNAWNTALHSPDNVLILYKFLISYFLHLSAIIQLA